VGLLVGTRVGLIVGRRLGVTDGAWVGWTRNRHKGHKGRGATLVSRGQEFHGV
jgi:hypothetical protein